MNKQVVLLVLLCGLTQAYAQGQDSRPWERDLQVIATMLPGQYNNANQAYFDGRTSAPVKHRRIHLNVEARSGTDLGEYVFQVEGHLDGDSAKDTGTQLWVLRPDHEARAVRMRRWLLSPRQASRERLRGRDLDDSSCDVVWQREAQQFRGSGDRSCAEDFATELVLSEQQLWATLPAVGGADGADMKLHRARAFECYADIPGVGGGRAEPYDRYDGFKLHDQGGQVWFTSKEQRRLGISLFQVDWPINNYEGVFTRDSLVIYVSEEIDGVRKELGYAFTEPDAERVGINLKWMLASCFMLSNQFATPSM